MWILGWEYEMSAVESSCMLTSAFFPDHATYTSASTGRSLTTIVFAVIGNHQHDLPLEDVVSNETATYAGNVFVALHEFELATQEPGGC